MKEIKTIEEWREIKMPIVYFKRQPSRVKTLEGGEISFTAENGIDFYNDKSWLFNSAKILNKWAIGESLTEEEFDAGIEKAAKHSPEQ